MCTFHVTGLTVENFRNLIGILYIGVDGLFLRYKVLIEQEKRALKLLTIARKAMIHNTRQYFFTDIAVGRTVMRARIPIVTIRKIIHVNLMRLQQYHRSYFDSGFTTGPVKEYDFFRRKC